MARYLTPSKVGLLALISLYTESVVPAKSCISILSFLIDQLPPVSPRLETDDAKAAGKHPSVTLDNIRTKTSSHESGIPGRTVWDLLLNKLWKIDSLDALHVFFDCLSLMLESQADEQHIQDETSNRVRLSRNSPLGVFVRRCQLEFARLQFHDSVSLWQSFAAFRLPTLQEWKKRNQLPQATGLVNDLLFEGLSHDMRTPRLEVESQSRQGKETSTFSTEDVERLLEHQVNQIQSPAAQSTKLSNLCLTEHRAGNPTPRNDVVSIETHAASWRFYTEPFVLCTVS